MLTPGACVGDGGSIWWAPEVVNSIYCFEDVGVTDAITIQPTLLMVDPLTKWGGLMQTTSTWKVTVNKNKLPISTQSDIHFFPTYVGDLRNVFSHEKWRMYDQYMRHFSIMCQHSTKLNFQLRCRNVHFTTVFTDSSENWRPGMRHMNWVKWECNRNRRMRYYLLWDFLS